MATAIVVISIEAEAFVLASMAYFSMPETNHSATASDWALSLKILRILIYYIVCLIIMKLHLLNAGLHGIGLISV